MSSNETAMRLRMLLLKQPKRLWLRQRLAKTKPDLVSIQINNKVYQEPANQTVLQVARKNGYKIPFNFRRVFVVLVKQSSTGRLKKVVSHW